MPKVEIVRFWPRFVGPEKAEEALKAYEKAQDS